VGQRIFDDAVHGQRRRIAVNRSRIGPSPRQRHAAIFTGLRASELRGLRSIDVELERNEPHVRQRADVFGTIGTPKSRSGTRTIPLPPIVINTLREWKLQAGPVELVFSARDGGPVRHRTVTDAGWHPAQIAASVVDEKGAPSIRASTHCATSTLRGASTGRPTAGSSCRSRWSKPGSDMPPSR
jgi:integrase